MIKVVSIFAVIVSLLASVVSGVPRQSVRITWEEYKERYNKIYDSPEEEIFRQTIFEKRVEEIEHHNHQLSEIKGYQKGVNHMTDLTDEEYRNLNKLKVQEKDPNKSSDDRKILEKVLFYANQPTYELPLSIDWSRKSNRVGSVRNQGHCGSCWAFATIGLIEGQEYRNSTSNSVIELSEQNLVDCDTKDRGCEGGIMSDAIDFIIKEGGLMTEKDYPYKSTKGVSFECGFDRTKAFVTTWGFKSSYVLPEGDEATLQKVVAEYGPVAVGINADSTHFRDYTSGVYFDESCVNITNIDHAVLVVGYGTDEKQGDYWLIKNSWSEAWGEKGYAKLARNRNNHCGVADVATIAV